MKGDQRSLPEAGDIIAALRVGIDKLAVNHRASRLITTAGDTPRSYYDEVMAKLKSKRIIAYVLVAATFLIGLGTALDAVEKVKHFWPRGRPAATTAKTIPIWCQGGRTVYIPEANIAVKLESDKNYINNKAILWVSYPPSASIVFDESAFMAVGIQRSLSFRLGVNEEVYLGTLGKYVFYLSDPLFNTDRKHLSGINVRALWKAKPKNN